MATRAPVAFEAVDHTGDLGIVVSARGLAELFERAAAAMFAHLADVSRVEPLEEETVVVEAPDQEALLVAWLSELLARNVIEGKLYSWFDVIRLEESALEARVRGEGTDPVRHGCQSELKAVTYHGLRVARKGGLWEARVIFDV